MALNDNFRVGDKVMITVGWHEGKTGVITTAGLWACNVLLDGYQETRGFDYYEIQIDKQPKGKP